MPIRAELKRITESCKQEYIDRYIKYNIAENVMLVAELQLKLAEDLKSVSRSIEHERLLKDLHKEFIDFSTSY